MSARARQDLRMGILNDVLLRIEAGKSPKASDEPACDGETGVLKVSAVSWNRFDAAENKAVFSDFDATGVPRPTYGDLLISRANTVELVGAVVVVEEDYPNLILSDKILRLVPDPKIADGRYLLYALRSREARKHMESRATGTSGSMRNISQDTIRTAPVLLPPLAEQKRIAGILDKADAIRRKRQRAIELTQQFLRSTFLHMFGDPVTNSNNWPTSRIGEVLLESRSGATVRPDDFREQGVPVLHKGSVKPCGKIELDEKKKTFVDATFAGTSTKSIVGREYVVVTLRDLVPTAPSIGLASSLARAPFDQYLLVERIYAFKCDPKKVLADYFVWLSNSIPFRALMRTLAVGATQVHIRRETYNGIEIPKPPIELQRKFKQIVERCDTAERALENSEIDLTKLFNSLVQSAFCGEL